MADTGSERPASAERPSPLEPSETELLAKIRARWTPEADGGVWGAPHWTQALADVANLLAIIDARALRGAARPGGAPCAHVFKVADNWAECFECKARFLVHGASAPEAHP